MKKLITLFIVLCMLGVNCVFAAEDISVLTDGGVSISGKAQSGVNVTLEVLKSADEWLAEENWITEPTAGVVFVGVTEADSDGNYTFDFYLDASGEYDCVTAYEDITERFRIIYTNKSENAETIAEINASSSADGVYDILKRDDTAARLMVASSEIYKSIEQDATVKDGTLPLEKAAEIIYEAERTDDPDEVSVMLQRAALIVALNGDSAEELDDIQPYYDILGAEELGLSDYYKKENSEYITELIKKDRISGIEDFNEKLRDAVILTNIRYSDSIDNTSEMLKRFADEIGVSESKITTQRVRNMLGETFDSLEDVKKCITGDTTEQRPSGGGGSGGSGSGRNSGGGISSGVTADSKKYSSEYENPPGTTEGILPFEDIDSVEWAKPSISALYTRGIISGKTDKLFCPDDCVTREEFVKMIVSAFSLDVLGSGMQFEDVRETDWYYDYVRSAYYADIVKGVSDTLFGAGQNITRQDIAVMCCRTAEISGIEMPETTDGFEFADDSEISDYAYESVGKMQRSGIINGDDTGSFNPKDYATRAEAAKIIHYLSDLI